MNNGISLEGILNESPYKYKPIINRVEDAAKWIYSILYDYSEEKINIVSHLADADGFGSQIVFHKGLELLLDFLGNSFKQVESTRVMSFSSEKKEDGNLERLRKVMGEGKWIICDSPTLIPADANSYLNELLIVDHHPVKEGFDSQFINVNPHLDGINGSKELSASMLSTLIINRVYEMIENDFAEDRDKTTKRRLHKLREDLDYVSIFGLAGAQADMQDDSGLNGAMYRYLEERGVIKKINSPFYGYNSKNTEKVWAQHTPLFNMMYEIPNSNEISKHLKNKFETLSEDKNELLQKIGQKHRLAFAKSESGFGINVYYLRTLSEYEIKGFNKDMKELTGMEAILIDETSGNGHMNLTVNEPFNDSGFYDANDDVTNMELRVRFATDFIKDLGFDIEKPLSLQQREFRRKLKRLFVENYKAFCDREDLEWALLELEKEQFVPTIEKGLVSNSIPEIANMMTAMSKQREGDLFMGAVDEVLYGRTDIKGNNHVSKIYLVNEKYREYKECVFKAMTKITDSRETIETISEEVFFQNYDFLMEVFRDTNIDLRTMIGVCGGIACNTKLIPSGKGILFTGSTFYQSKGKQTIPHIKISGRATTCQKYMDIRVNKFMERFGGGGHGPAAACTIPLNDLEMFLEEAKKFDFNRGDYHV